MTNIKTGLWQNTLDGSFIKVRRSGRIGVYYNDEGCDIEHVMSKKEFNHCYILVNADKPVPVIDDTFNDDTPAQTFGQWKHETGKTCVCLGCKTVIPINSPEFKAINKGAKCSACFPNASKMRLIGIAGPARAGKDTLASYLLDNLSDDWSRSSFADPLKDMLRAIGVDCSDDKKAVIDDSYGATPRHMMQTLGTEWGRHMIDGDIWVKAFARLNAGKCVIVPDVRFEDEAELVREHGVLIHLVGRGGIEGNHVSENAIEFKPGDIVIDNSRDLAWLHSQVDGNAVLGDFVNNTQGEIK